MTSQSIPNVKRTKQNNNTWNVTDSILTICSTSWNKTTYTLNPKNAISKRKRSTILVLSSATVEYKWTQRNSKVLQTGPSPATQQKSTNSLGLPATIDILSKDIQK